MCSRIRSACAFGIIVAPTLGVWPLVFYLIVLPRRQAGRTFFQILAWALLTGRAQVGQRLNSWSPRVGRLTLGTARGHSYSPVLRTYSQNRCNRESLWTVRCIASGHHGPSLVQAGFTMPCFESVGARPYYQQ